MLVAQPLEHSLRRVPLLRRPGLIVCDDLVDDPDERIQLRPLRWCVPPVPGRNREHHHLGHRPRVDPEPPRRLAMAQPLNLHRIANPPVQLHALHPPPSANRKGLSAAGLLLRRNRTNPAASVREFCSGAYKRPCDCWRMRCLGYRQQPDAEAFARGPDADHHDQRHCGRADQQRARCCHWRNCSAHADLGGWCGGGPVELRGQPGAVRARASPYRGCAYERLLLYGALHRNSHVGGATARATLGAGCARRSTHGHRRLSASNRAPCASARP